MRQALNPEMVILTRIMSYTNGLKHYNGLGLTRSDFSDNAATLYDMIVAHDRKHGQSPSVEYFRASYSNNFVPAEADDADAALIERMRVTRVGAVLGRSMQPIQDLAGADPLLALTRAKEAIRLAENILKPARSNRITAGSGFSHLIDRMARQKDGQILGIPWPWDWLNRDTQGIAPDDMIYIYGREKSLKTMFMIWMLNHFERLGYKILVVTREMSLRDIEELIVCMRMKMNLTEFKGWLPPERQSEIGEEMEALHRRGRIQITDAGGGLDGLYSAILEDPPDLVCHDAWKYTANDERAANPRRFATEESALTYCIEQTREWVMLKRIPLIAVGHANRDQDVAGSDAISRRMTGMFRIYKDPEEPRIGVRLQSWRRAPESTFTLRAGLCENFGEFVDFGTEWVETALQQLKHGVHTKKKK